MSAKKMMGIKLPISPKTLLDIIGIAEKQSSRNLMVSVFVDHSLDSDFLSIAKELFRPQSSTCKITVIPYFGDVLEFAPNSDLVVLLANEAPATGALLIKALREQVSAVAVTLDAARLQRVARDNYNEIDQKSIITVYDRSLDAVALYEQLFKDLGAWIVRHFSEQKLSFARAFSFVRDPFVEDVILATSLQNTVISAVFFLPGADMPLLTLNQCKMFLQIGAAYGADISTQRLKELAVLLASGFGLRAIARRLVGLVPMFGWAMRGAVGFSGSFAIGQAAKAYFENGGDIIDIVKGLVPKKIAANGIVAQSVSTKSNVPTKVG